MMNLGKPFTSKISDDLKEPMVHVAPFPHGTAHYWGKTLEQQILRCDKILAAITLHNMQISFYSPTHGGFREWEGHEVKSNETMVGIALKYDITVEDIRRCNNLWTNDALWPGQVIFFCSILYCPWSKPISNAISSHNKYKNIL